MLLYSCVATYHSGELLGTLCKRFPEGDSYPRLVRAVALRAMPASASTHRRERIATLAAMSANMLQFLAYYFDTIAQMLYVAQYFDQLVTPTPPSKRALAPCQWAWLALTFFLVVPMLWVPSFAESRWMAVPSMVGIAVTVVIFVAEVAVTDPWHCSPGPVYARPSPYSVFLSMGAYMYQFGGHGMFPEMIREMKRPEDWSAVLKWTYAVVVAMYAICGYLGYAAYGAEVQANINLSWPGPGAGSAGAMNVVSIAIQLVVCWYLVYLTNITLLLNIEIDWLRLSPTSQSARTKVRRMAFRTAFLATQTIVGLMLLSGSGDIILGLQSLCGSIGMSALTCFVPFVLAWLTAPKDLSAATKGWFGLNICVGVLVMVGGILSSLTDIFDNGGGIFAGYCHLEYAYSNCTRAT